MAWLVMSSVGVGVPLRAISRSASAAWRALLAAIRGISDGDADKAGALVGARVHDRVVEFLLRPRRGRGRGRRGCPFRHRFSS